MKKFLKWLVVAIVLLLIAVVIAFYTLVDRDELRALVAQDANGYQIRVQGDVTINPLMLSLIWEDVVLKDPDGNIILTASDLDVSPRFPGILTGKRTVNIRLKGLVASGVPLGYLGFPVNLEEKTLVIAPLSGQLANGRVRGRIVVSQKNYMPMEMTLDVTGIDYSHFSETVSGTADISARLTAKDYGEWVKTLNGHAVLIGGEGVFPPGVDFWATDIFPKLLPFGDEVKETRLNCLASRFNIKDGIAVTPGILMDTQRVTVAGKGQIDLSDGKISFLFDPKPKNASLISLATPVRVSGTFLDASIAPEALGMAKKLGGFALGAINPALLALPLLDTGELEAEPCKKFIANLTAQDE